MLFVFLDMDTICYFTTLTLLLICQKVQADSEKLLQNEPQDDSFRIFKFLQLYQQQQERLANSKSRYANDLSGRYYPESVHRGKSSRSDEDDSEYERPHGRSWNSEDVQRVPEHPPLSETTPEVVKSESPSGYISVKVYPPTEEQSKDEGDMESLGDVESSTGVFVEELLQEDKKSLQTQLNSDGNFKSYSPNLSANNGPLALRHSSDGEEKAHKNPFSDLYFIVIVAGCSAAAIFGVIAAGYCFYKFQKTSKAAAEVDYPAYGVTGPSKEHTSPSGDRKLAQSAQMYHYQHQKQQMIAVENATTNRQASNSDVDSEEENEEGDYTVYECPGLAPTGEMEVKNPLFHDDSTPMSPPVVSKEMKKP